MCCCLMSSATYVVDCHCQTRMLWLQGSAYMQVMEVQPAVLAERMGHHSTSLEPGKATCLLAARYRRCLVNIQLMDVLDLQLSL